MMDMVHDIVAALAGDDPCNGWASIQRVLEAAVNMSRVNPKHPPETCMGHMENWVSLEIMMFNSEETIIKFAVPPCDP